MQNFDEFLRENYNMTEEEYYDMENPLYEDYTKRIIWAEFEAHVESYIGK